MSVLRSLAEHFHRDAVDFGARFDLLWEAGPLMHKMGRTKTFTDLLMGCECALKAQSRSLRSLWKMRDKAAQYRLAANIPYGSRRDGRMI